MYWEASPVTARWWSRREVQLELASTSFEHASEGVRHMAAKEANWLPLEAKAIGRMAESMDGRVTSPPQKVQRKVGYAYRSNPHRELPLL
jgi:hypothetical protein